MIIIILIIVIVMVIKSLCNVGHIHLQNFHYEYHNYIAIVHIT